MAAGGEVILSGAYNVVYASAALGIFHGDGLPTLEVTHFGQKVNNTDRYGQALLEIIYRGIDVSFTGRLMEYKAAGLAAFAPYAALGLLGIIGRSAFTSAASPLVFTSVAGTPAAATPATLTAGKATLAPDTPMRILFGPIVRELPLKLLFLLYDTGGGAIGHFLQT